jgi:hypothetical protein
MMQTVLLFWQVINLLLLLLLLLLHFSLQGSD